MAIIGAGPSGLAQLRAFQKHRRPAEEFQTSFAFGNKQIGAVYGIMTSERE